MWVFAFGLLCGLLAYGLAAARQRHIEALQRIDLIDERLERLDEKISSLTRGVVSLLPALEQQKRHFDALPHLRIEKAKELESGDALALNVFDYAGIRRIEFVFDRLEFRSPDEKDAVAYGKARTAGAEQYHGARIFINRHAKTAKLFGESSSNSPFFADGGSGYAKLA